MATVEGPRLPVEFLGTLAREAEPDSVQARLVAEQLRADPDGHRAEAALTALLGKAYRESAPRWMLEAAVRRGTREVRHWYPEQRMDLAALALGHPDCPPDLLRSTLADCPPEQLACLGRADSGAVVAGGVAEEVKRRVPSPPSMTRELLDEPTVPQLVLRGRELHDVVFAAAFEVMPTAPTYEGVDSEYGRRRHQEAHQAWGRMWSFVLHAHPDRHEEAVLRADEAQFGKVIRRQLMKELPWKVEPHLLRKLAEQELEEFAAEVLLTRMARLVRDGDDEAEVRRRFADELAGLSADRLAYVHDVLRLGGVMVELNCDAALEWGARATAADGTWRHILWPDEATSPQGQPRDWRASPEELAQLTEEFARATAEALRLWEAPRDDWSGPRPTDLAWVPVVLAHLPELDEQAKAAARGMVRAARRRASFSRTESADGEKGRAVLDAITAVTDPQPPPRPPVVRTEPPLGDPDTVTVRRLGELKEAALRAYLEEHPGHDGLIEKALVSLVLHRLSQETEFVEDVLTRHSEPAGHLLLCITRELRKRMGGGPQDRERWAWFVLDHPACRSDTVRALPAWTALGTLAPYAEGDGWDRPVHPLVMAEVRAALLTDEAWKRFAHAPIGNSGPAAWLRLGDVLDAAAEAAAWPSPPAAR
ncbi:hypothetical protein ACIO3O_03510 [Streptomyces sp. NPDC087440]|uniref:hypothetical protein n=1 Tax=Streptomyces sp. NPDC087440 TaxID=3365790 RepID=UPI00380C6E63